MNKSTPIIFSVLVSFNGYAADLMTGNFSATNFWVAAGGSATPTIESISGSWSLTFDEPILLSSTQTVTLDSFSLSPTVIGATSWDTSNVVAELQFVSGDLSQVTLGGTPNGAQNWTTADDWKVSYYVVADGTEVSFSDVSFSGYAVSEGLFMTTEQSGSLSVSNVPLPAAVWLFISALGGLVVAKRNNSKRNSSSQYKARH